MPETKQRRKQPSKQARQEAERLAYLRARGRRSRRVTFVAVLAAVGIAGVGIVSLLAPRVDDERVEQRAAAAASTTAPDARPPADESGCPRPDGSSVREAKWPSPPPVCISPDKRYEAVVETDAGQFTIALDNRGAPQTVNNFVFLSRFHFYDGLTFHKAKPGFVVQTGDPPDKGVTNAGYVFNDENLPRPRDRYVAGDVIMAKDKPNTNGSQFLIITGPEGEGLPPQFSRFGRVTEGMDVVRRISDDGCTVDCKDLAPEKVHAIRRVTIIEI